MRQQQIIMREISENNLNPHVDHVVVKGKLVPKSLKELEPVPHVSLSSDISPEPLETFTDFAFDSVAAVIVEQEQLSAVQDTTDESVNSPLERKDENLPAKEAEAKSKRRPPPPKKKKNVENPVA